MEDVVKQAEAIVDSLINPRTQQIALTTTQIRKFLTSVNAINNKLLAYQNKTGEGEDLETLPPDLADEVRYLEVKLVYQCGKDKTGAVKDFVEKAKLLERIRNIGNSRKKYDEFAKLIEAIVAFHKFKGGRD